VPAAATATTIELFPSAVTHVWAPVYEDLAAQAWQIIGFNLSLQMYLQLGAVTVTDGVGKTCKDQRGFNILQ